MNDETITKSTMFYEGMLPGNIYRTRVRSFGRIIGVSNNEEEARQIDKEQLYDVARKMLREWSNMVNAEVDQTLMTALEQPERMLEVAAPEAVYVEPFPMMLQCDRCGVLDNHRGFSRSDEVIQKTANRVKILHGRPVLDCRRKCGGQMRQIRHISIHRCGKMETIAIPHGVRDVSNLGYEDRGGTFIQSRFINADTGEAVKIPFQSVCRDCAADNPNALGVNKRGTPIDNPEKFYAHNIQYLCLKRETGRQISQITDLVGAPGDPLTDDSRDIAEAVASCLIGQSTSDELASHIGEMLGGDGPDRERIEALTHKLGEERRNRSKLVKEMTGKMSADLIAIATAALDTIIKGLEEQLTIASGRFSSVRDLISSDQTLQNIASHRRSLEATLMPYDYGKERLGIKELIQETQDSVQRDKLTHDASVLRTQYGIADVAHYKEVNVVMASIGYTRERLTPSDDPPGQVVPTTLVGYEDLMMDRLRGKRMIYGLPARTEALHVRLDPCRVLQWCVDAAGWEEPTDGSLIDPVKARAYLLMHCPALSMDPREVIEETHHQSPLCSAPFHLLHSVSHCLLGTIKPHTGYNEKSVTEYLMPMDLSVILYVTSVQNYTAGGLLTLFKHYLRDWFDDASRYAFNCIFDPICSDNGSSCSGCVQIVLGCETFNHGLSRSYLHGGKLEGDQQLMVQEGFWR